MPEYTSQQIYDRIAREAKHKKSVKALNNVKDACDFLQDKAKTEITITKIGSYCSERDGGPKTQSILNNKNLASYIQARRAEQNLPMQPNSAEPEIRTGNALVDSYVAGVQSELRISRRNENRLRDIFRRHAEELGGFDMDESLKQDRFVTKDGPPVPSPTAIPSDLAPILRKFLDPAFMESLGFVQQDGCVFSPERNDKALLTKREVDCIQRVIEETGKKS